MRIALLSDIHGNPIALDAALDDVQQTGGVDGYWFIGDLTAIGFDPVGVLKRICNLPNGICTRGNSEAYLLEGVRPGFPDPAPQTEAEWRHQIEISRNFAFTYGQVWQAGYGPFLAELPIEFRTTLPDGTRVLCVHASPGKIDGKGFRPDQPEAVMRARINSAEADLVFVGHTHWPMNRLIGNIHLVNLGSISNQSCPDLRAKYVILEADSTGYTIEHRYVHYDRAACLAYCQTHHFPGSDFVGMLAEGQFVAKWQRGRSSAELQALLPQPSVKHARPGPNETPIGRNSPSK